MTRIGALIAALVGAPLMALAVMTGTASASAPAASIHLTNQLPIQSDGSVLASLNYMCNPSVGGSPGSVQVYVQQLGVFGLLSTPATCDGTKHALTFDVVPSGGTWQPGTATVTAQVCNAFFFPCVTTNAQLKVQA